MEFGNDMTQQTQWTFAHANLLHTCYGKLCGIMTYSSMTEMRSLLYRLTFDPQKNFSAPDPQWGDLWGQEH